MDASLAEMERHKLIQRLWLWGTAAVAALDGIYLLLFRLVTGMELGSSPVLAAPGFAGLPFNIGADTITRWLDIPYIFVLSLILYVLAESRTLDELLDDDNRSSTFITAILVIFEAICIGIGSLLSVGPAASVGFFVLIGFVFRLIGAAKTAPSWAGVGRGLRIQALLAFWNAIYIGIWNGFVVALVAWILFTTGLFIVITVVPALITLFFGILDTQHQRGPTLTPDTDTPHRLTANLPNEPPITFGRSFE